MIKNSFQSFIQQVGIVVAAVSAAGSFCSRAAEPQPLLASNSAPTITLDALAADVLEHNPELGFYRAEIQAAAGERRMAGTFANPEFSTTVGGKRVAVGPLTSDGVAWSVSVQQTFEWPGRIPLRKAIANHQIKLAQLGFDQFRTALAARSRTLAYNLFAAQEKAAAAREVAERFQALREVLVQRDPAGLTPVLETRIIEASELTLQRKATEAALAEQSALLELNQLRGKPWEQPIKIAPPNLSFPSFPGLEPFLASAQTNNFEIRMREAELEQQGFKVSLAKNEKYPAVTIGPYFSQERAGDRETQAGIGLSIPVPLWNRNSGKVAAEEARLLQAETLLSLAHRNLERQVIEKAMAYQTRLDEMAKWRPDSVEKFKEAAALADRHYRLGAVPITTYVELQKQYLDAVEALLSTKLDALDAARELQRLTGIDLSKVVPTKPEDPK
jgi:cobalt-zinc-cadmium efflux system outer membrane protein